MTEHHDIAAHYGRHGLLERLEAALSEDGVDPARPTIEALAPYDHFHGRGLEATEELVATLSVSRGDRLLDIGSGLGGPARLIARRFGCRVTGIDLTDAFCNVARHLGRAVGLDAQVDFELGDALAMTFADATFDGAYSMNVSMNIADKGALLAEIRRVLKPGGWLVLSELAQGPGGAPEYPTPWAADASASFLSTPAQTVHELEAAGFEVLRMRETAAEAEAFAARSRAVVERGGKPPHRAVQLIHGELAPRIMRNMARNMAQARLVPVEVHARSRRA